MSSYLRPRVPGATIFFTVRLNAGGSTLLTDEIDGLRQAVAVTQRERPFTIDAFVVLPDHLHCVWTLPEGDCEYSERWGAIKTRFTRSLRDACRVGFHPTLAKAAGKPVGWNPTLRRSVPKVAKGDSGIWQRRFWEHHIRDDEEYRALVEYCWLNPVKHGLAAHPLAWPHSSAHRDQRRFGWEEGGIKSHPTGRAGQTYCGSPAKPADPHST